jgi:hypothetical protein
VAARESATLDLATFERSPLRDALLSQITGAHERGAVDFSETIGLAPDQGLDFWLGIVGAARILLSPEDDFSKLGPLPLATFDQEPVGASPLYLLAGFEQPFTRLAVAVADDGRGDPAPCPSHPTFPGLFELPLRSVRPGNHLLTLQIDMEAALTIPVCTLANRATLVTASRDPSRTLVIQQFVLPIPHLAFQLPYVQRLTWERPLPVVRRLVELQRQFAESRKLSEVLREEELMNLLYVKWFEPVSCLLAAYELARRGASDELKIAVSNLRQHFAEMPDTEAIAKRAGLEWTMPASPPLVLDGLLELELMDGGLPLDAEELDYRGPWTAWLRR